MKIKEGFLLRKIAGQNMVIPTGGDLELNMMITLNGTGAFLWECLQEEKEEKDLVTALLKEYDVDESTAKASVAAFVDKLRANGFLA